MEASTMGTEPTRTDPTTVNPSEAVVSAVAETAGVEPTDLPPLFDAIDPDALDALFDAVPAASRESGSIAFTYAGYQVRVAADGTVDLNGSNA